ncbi:MAG: SUMF1/EgtB/PvdO family nonheme iron enzyme [Planctomycetes bacterium]|nr:SUMF1/EgtB/PvdO family nonheme iron enzyme [Planctomycetota bacterium]
MGSRVLTRFPTRLEAVTRDFHIDRTEVTRDEWALFLEETGRRPPPGWSAASAAGAAARLPATNLSWDEAAAYCRYAGKRLPTEREWELAARGRDAREFPWGSEFDAARCVFRARGPEAVGSRPAGASPCGALDMAGSVWEWVDGREGDSRVARGGSWQEVLEDALRSGYRNLLPADTRREDLGLRCAADD